MKPYTFPTFVLTATLMGAVTPAEAQRSAEPAKLSSVSGIASAVSITRNGVVRACSNLDLSTYAEKKENYGKELRAWLKSCDPRVQEIIHRLVKGNDVMKSLTPSQFDKLREVGYQAFIALSLYDTLPQNAKSIVKESAQWRNTLNKGDAMDFKLLSLALIEAGAAFQLYYSMLPPKAQLNLLQSERVQLLIRRGDADSYKELTWIIRGTHEQYHNIHASSPKTHNKIFGKSAHKSKKI